MSEVLSATLEEFAERGYVGLSVESVALRAGVNKTTVYRRWPTKADLVSAALSAMRDAAPEPPDTGSLRGDLLPVLQNWVARLTTPRGRAIAQSMLLGQTDPEMQSIVRRMRVEHPAIPPVLFTRAIKRRELPKHVDTALITSALLGALHGRAHWQPEDLDGNFVRSLLDLVLDGALVGAAGRR